MDDRTGCRGSRDAEGAALPPGDVRAKPAVPKLHMTGKGLSPEDYRARHGGHDHEADLSGDPEQGPQRDVERHEDQAGDKTPALSGGRP